MSNHTTAASDTDRLNIAVLGCSGSIGTQTLDVARHHSSRVQILALSVHHNTKKLVEAAREFSCSYVAVTDLAHSDDSVLQELPQETKLLVGPEALVTLATLPEVDCVVSAVVGFAGIESNYAAAKAGKRLAYANKESIVVGGDLIMPLLHPGQLIPVDSEHSAIFQCLQGEQKASLYRIWLTCSGGPFFGKVKQELEHVTVQDALAHPTWSMGSKITIDSATLMNKGLEVIEACHLFDVSEDKITVLIQRQSRIHSMVEFRDGSIKAQLGASDMRACIRYALSYPKRWDSPEAERIDWGSEPPITFNEPDMETFGCLKLARQASRTGRTMPCAMNAANEVANAAFRRGDCGFLDIERTCAAVMEHHTIRPVESVHQLEEVDAESRAQAREYLAERL